MIIRVYFVQTLHIPKILYGEQVHYILTTVTIKGYYLYLDLMGLTAR